MTTLAQIQEAVDAAQQRAPGPRCVRVYISGPIASDPNARQTFAAAQAGIDMRWFGYEAVNPFDIAPLSHPGQPCAEGYHPGASDASEHTSSACYMRTDLLALLSCDAIHMLPGWRESKGATVEHAVAVACGMPVTFAAATDGEASLNAALYREGYNDGMRNCAMSWARFSPDTIPAHIARYMDAVPS